MLYNHEYWCDVPEEEDARRLADILVARGHRYVRVARRPSRWPRPGNESWRVGSLIEDEERPSWAAAFEEATVARLAREAGGYASYGQVGDRSLLGHIDREGLVHDAGSRAARVRRREVEASFPEPPPPLVPGEPLDVEPVDIPVAAVRAAAAELIESGRGSGDLERWTDPAWPGPDAEGDVLETLGDEYLPQGEANDQTQAGVRLGVSLVHAPGLGSFERLCLLTFLLDAATVHVVRDANPTMRMSLDDELAPERAARIAVENEAPDLLAGWSDEDEAVRFGLALIAAVASDAARRAGVIPEIAALADRTTDPHRALALRLAHALAARDDDRLADLLVATAGVREGLLELRRTDEVPEIAAAFERLRDMAVDQVIAVSGWWYGAW